MRSEDCTSYFSIHTTGFCFHLLSIKRAKCNRMLQENPGRNLGEQRWRLCSNRDQLEAEPLESSSLALSLHTSHLCRENHCPPVMFKSAAITKWGARKSGLARRAHKMLKAHCKEFTVPAAKHTPWLSCHAFPRLQVGAECEKMFSLLRVCL